MPFTRAFFNTVIDALFPVPLAEREVLAMGQMAAFKDLPRAERPQIGEACSIFAYKDERITRLIWSIKYKKSRAGAALAGYALYRVACRFASALPEGVRAVVVPMPITRARRRERGFNQCELILDEMEKLDTDKRLIFAQGLLLRVKHTSRQTMKDRGERLESIKGVFAVNEEVFYSLEARDKDVGRLGPHPCPALPKNCFIIVIDDVITTGSTMRDAINTLRQAGFKNSYGLSVAH